MVARRREGRLRARGAVRTAVTAAPAKLMHSSSWPAGVPSAVRGLEIVELTDTHGAVREPGNDVELAAHCLDVAPDRAHVHIGAAFHLRHLRLRGAQSL